MPDGPGEVGGVPRAGQGHSTIATTKALSQTLQCHAHYRDVGDRKQIRKEWQRADRRVVIATNAFGLGIDEPRGGA
jgi:superfamily II DNA helicase RecQ